jgi:hypothetical protein
VGDSAFHRLVVQVENYRGLVGQPWFVVPTALAVLSAVPRVPSRLRGLALACLPLSVVVPCLLALGDGGSTPGMGRLPAVLLVLLVPFLAVPLTAWAVARRRSDVGVLLVLALPAAAVSLPVVAAATLSSATWGAVASAAAPAVTAVLVGWGAMTERFWRGAGRVASGVLLAAIVVLLALTPFRDPFPWLLSARVESGAYAGVVTTRETAESIADIEAAARRWVRPGDEVLFFGIPGGYALVDAPMATNVQWLATLGDTRATVDWFARRHRYPDVVFVDRRLLRQAGGFTAAARTDPLFRYLASAYSAVDVAPTGRGPAVLLRSASE